MIYNIKVSEFNEFFKDNIQKEIIDTLSIYKLIEENKINLRNPEIKNIINYFIAFYLCKHINTQTTNKAVFIVQPEIIQDNLDIVEFCLVDSLRNMIRKTLMILHKKHPKNIIILKKVLDLESPDATKFIFQKSNS